MIANKGDKVVCVKKGGNNFVTIGKIYEVLEEGSFLNYYKGAEEIYLVRNDIGNLNCYSVDKFIPLSEWREQQINKII